MREREVSQTMIMTSIFRAAHLVLDGEPKILDDPVSLGLVEGSTAAEIRAQTDKWQQSLRAQARSRTVVRSRFAEDQLAQAHAEGVRQYLALGAGMDTFAYRQPPWAADLLIVEIDHPASQRYKRECLQKRQIALPANLVFCPIDFEYTSLVEGLKGTAFNPQKPAFISWLGVTQYLTRPAIEAVFRYVLSLPASSRIDFTFSVPPVAEDHEAVVERAMPEVRGEPRLSYFSPEEMLDWLRELGFSRWVHLSPALCEERYFAGRTDGLPASHRIQSICAHV